MVNSSETKLKIQNALLELMRSIDSDRIAVVDVAREAEISRATFYRYYSSVDDVLREMEDEFLEGMRDCSRYYISSPFDANCFDEPNPSFVAISEYVYQRRKFYLAITSPHGDSRFVYGFKKCIREFYCGKLAYEGLARKDLDVYMEFALAGNVEVLRYWLKNRPDISAAEIALIAQRSLYGPFVC